MADIDRSCGTCSICCKIVRVDELNKPAHQWCVHSVPRKGCGIHGSHPEVCNEWKCGWQTMPELDASWKPERCGFILRGELAGQQLVIDVDPTKPDAWRREPFYSWIKRRARAVDLRKQQVLVLIGPRAIAMYPEDEIDAGLVEPHECATLALHYRGELCRALVQIRLRETAEIIREVTGPWRPKAVFAIAGGGWTTLKLQGR